MKKFPLVAAACLGLCSQAFANEIECVSADGQTKLSVDLLHSNANISLEKPSYTVLYSWTSAEKKTSLLNTKILLTLKHTVAKSQASLAIAKTKSSSSTCGRGSCFPNPSDPAKTSALFIDSETQEEIDFTCND